MIVLGVGSDLKIVFGISYQCNIMFLASSGWQEPENPVSKRVGVLNLK